MASTNKTTNYNLSQYIGSDKPTYLGDYNADMLKIDNAMHQNALDIATADEKATLAGTNASTALTNAETAQTTADTANSTATTALSKATANETAISNIETGNIYSTTEEIDTGHKWIDGNEIYRKVIQYTLTSDLNGNSTFAQLDIPHGISNINKITDIRGFAEQTNQISPFVNGGWNSSLNSQWARYINQVTTTDIRIRIVKDTLKSGSKIDFIIEYTKSI